MFRIALAGLILIPTTWLLTSPDQAEETGKDFSVRPIDPVISSPPIEYAIPTEAYNPFADYILPLQYSLDEAAPEFYRPEQPAILSASNDKKFIRVILDPQYVADGYFVLEQTSWQYSYGMRGSMRAGLVKSRKLLPVNHADFDYRYPDSLLYLETGDLDAVDWPGDIKMEITYVDAKGEPAVFNRYRVDDPNGNYPNSEQLLVGNGQVTRTYSARDHQR